jgi:hypothetical protein
MTEYQYVTTTTELKRVLKHGRTTACVGVAVAAGYSDHRPRDKGWTSHRTDPSLFLGIKA